MAEKRAKADKEQRQADQLNKNYGSLGVSPAGAGAFIPRLLGTDLRLSRVRKQGR